jgi:hypothetical protein
MSERGVFAVDRGIWDHHVLSDNRPFSRREVWLWLLSNAAWKSHRRRVAGRSVELNRGQVLASLRFMADNWDWSEPRVRRFLALLEQERMIDVATDAGITVITVCKYDKYQRVSLPDDATIGPMRDAAATQQRRKVEDIEHKEDPIAAAPDEDGTGIGIAIARDEPTAPAPLRQVLISEEAFELARQVIDAMGPSAVGNIIEVGAPAHCQKWINEGWRPDFCLIVVRQVTGRRGRDNPPSTLKFFDKAISKYYAQMAELLPTTSIKSQETIYAATSNHAGNRPRGAGGYSSRLAGLQRLAQSLPRYSNDPGGAAEASARDLE